MYNIPENATQSEYAVILKYLLMVSHKQEMLNSKISQREKEQSPELMEHHLAMKLLNTEFSEHSLMKN